MAKGTKERERRPTIAGFVPGEVEAHFDVEPDNDEKTGVQSVILTCKKTGEDFTIAKGYIDPLFWYELGLHAAIEGGAKMPAGAGPATRIPPPK
jgi:hypothetical protein